MKKTKYCKECGAKLANQNKSGFCMKHCGPYRRNREAAIERYKIIFRGEGNPMYGKKHSSKTIEKMKANQWDRSHKKNPMYGKTHSISTRKKISKARSKMRGRFHHSDETKRKMRIAAIEYLKKTMGICPRYNKDACKFFDKLNSIFMINGKHAENGGEYYVEELGYWIDFIDLDNKIIIENNEKKHYNVGRRNSKTELKEREIKKYFSEFEYIVSNIPRTGKYDKERIEKIFEEEIKRITRRRAKIFRRRN